MRTHQNHHPLGEVSHYELANFLCTLCSMISGRSFRFAGGCESCGSGDKCSMPLFMGFIS